jgi:tetratricopeptide (TPR) repeat protein
LASLNRYEEALSRLNLALESDPGNADARENLGLLFFKRGLYPAAAEQLRKATALNPSRASAFLYLGEALNRMDEVDMAMEALERSIELRPSARAYYLAGILYDRKRQPGVAAEMYRKAEELGGW